MKDFSGQSFSKTIATFFLEEVGKKLEQGGRESACNESSHEILNSREVAA